MSHVPGESSDLNAGYQLDPTVLLPDSLSAELFTDPDIKFRTDLVPEEPVMLGVLKFCGTGAKHGYEDALDLSIRAEDVARMIRQYSGTKNKRIQTEISEALDYLSENPRGDGSRLIRGLRKGEPTFRKERIELWRFKPDEARGFTRHSGLRTTRFVYAPIVDDKREVVGLLDIISRSDFGKKYS